jgi:hypothetical protein
MWGFLRIVGLMGTAVALSACVTTGDVDIQLKSQWIGLSSDQFFTRYGPPASEFKLANGGKIYTWRGGQAVRHVDAQYEMIDDDPFMMGHRRHWHDHSDFWIGSPGVIMVSPPRDEPVYCEAEITVDKKRVIEAIRASGDTAGLGFSLSRCAEVLGIKK